MCELWAFIGNRHRARALFWYIKIGLQALLTCGSSLFDLGSFIELEKSSSLTSFETLQACKSSRTVTKLRPWKFQLCTANIRARAWARFISMHKKKKDWKLLIKNRSTFSRFSPKMQLSGSNDLDSPLMWTSITSNRRRITLTTTTTTTTSTTKISLSLQEVPLQDGEVGRQETKPGAKDPRSTDPTSAAHRVNIR